MIEAVLLGGDGHVGHDLRQRLLVAALVEPHLEVGQHRGAQGGEHHHHVRAGGQRDERRACDEGAGEQPRRAEDDPGFDRAAFLQVLGRFFDSAQLSSDWDSLKEADVELLVNMLSILCPFDPEEKQALLEAPTLTERRETLVTLMEFALRSGGDEGAMQ